MSHYAWTSPQVEGGQTYIWEIHEVRTPCAVTNNKGVICATLADSQKKKEKLTRRVRGDVNQVQVVYAHSPKKRSNQPESSEITAWLDLIYNPNLLI